MMKPSNVDIAKGTSPGPQALPQWIGYLGMEYARLRYAPQV